jgi:hypothetical protein
MSPGGAFLEPGDKIFGDVLDEQVDSHGILILRLRKISESLLGANLLWRREGASSSGAVHPQALRRTSVY